MIDCNVVMMLVRTTTLLVQTGVAIWPAVTGHLVRNTLVRLANALRSIVKFIDTAVEILYTYKQRKHEIINKQ